MMLSIIDYRNGRYQGQIKNGQPHGIGIFMHINLSFVISQWKQAQVEGNTIIIHPDGSNFFGQITKGKTHGLCHYELPHDHIQLITFNTEQTHPKIAAITPLFDLILQIDRGPNGTPQVIAEHPYSLLDPSINHISLVKALNISSAVQLQKYQTCANFFKQCFVQPYSDLFEFLILNLNGYKEYWMGFKEAGLGIRLQPLEINEDRSKNCARYRVREAGQMSKQNILSGIGYRTIDDARKGVIIEEGIFSITNTLNHYQLQENRPAKCAKNIGNHFKRSLYFRNLYLDVSCITQSLDLMHTFTRQIFRQQSERIAQFVIENPRKDWAIFESIEKKRRDKAIQCQLRIKQTLQSKETNSKMIHTHKFADLQTIKKQIYRSVSKLKSSRSHSKITLSASPNQFDEINIKTIQNLTPRRKSGTITPKKTATVNAKNNSRPKQSPGKIIPITQQKKPRVISIAPILKSPHKYQKDQHTPKVIFQPWCQRQNPQKQSINTLSPDRKKYKPQSKATPTRHPQNETSKKHNNAIHKKEKYQKRILTENVFI